MEENTTIFEIFRPREYLSSIYNIDFGSLKKKGIKGLIIDLDETLLPREMIEITPVLFAFVDSLKNIGFKIYLMSNSSKEKRVEYVGQSLDVPFMMFAMKPLPFSFEKAAKYMGLKNEDIAVIGDQLFMDTLGGNISRMYTILLKPMNPEKIWIREVMRKAENYVLKKLGLI